MKPLNFTVVEILPALLSKAKTQTIRPAFHRINKDFPIVKNYRNEVIEKPAAYKVGDKVKIYWNQRSKFRTFCRRCGSNVRGGIKGKDKAAWRCINDECDKKERFGNKAYFDKLLGQVEITEVFKIEMHPHMELVTYRNPNPEPRLCMMSCGRREIDELAKLDGFKSAEAMFEFFDKRYGLSEPKQFYVYRWRWLN